MTRSVVWGGTWLLLVFGLLSHSSRASATGGIDLESLQQPNDVSVRAAPWADGPASRGVRVLSGTSTALASPADPRGRRAMQSATTALTDANIYGAVAACLGESVDGSCPSATATFGAMASWDVGQVTTMAWLFFQAGSFTGDVSGWDVSQVTSMAEMFNQASSFNGDLSAWDVRRVTAMQGMFAAASSFNGDLSAWNVGQVTNIQGMFSGASSFNGDVSTWNVAQVSTMAWTFAAASTFNGDLSGWNVSQVTNMDAMFNLASSFSGDVSGWNVGRVSSMQSMFYGAQSFTSDLSGWDVGHLTSVQGMFDLASSFNGDLSSWNPGQVTNMQGVFNGATTFAGDISQWDVGHVMNMAWMFQGAVSFDSDLSGWNVGQVTTMQGMFARASSFDSDISAWDVSQVTTMARMFDEASSFAGDLSAWDVGQVATMEGMFYQASSFASDLSRWSVGQVTNMASMFFQASSFNGDISGWSVGQVTNMNEMFCGAGSFNGDLSSWNIERVTTMENMFKQSAVALDFRAPSGPWDVSSVATTEMYTDTCSNNPGRCEAECVAFSDAFPDFVLDFPGYQISNPSGTTVTGLGVRRCVMRGYVAVVTCNGEWSLSGCPVPPVCTTPATTPGYIVISEINLDWNVGMFDVAASCTPGHEGVAAASCSVNGPYTLSGCSPCVPGKYSVALLVGSLACGDCVAGKYIDVYGSSRASDCIDCLPGRYADVPASTTCIDCLAGKYAAVSGNDQCIACTPGAYTDIAGSAACTECPVGKYADGSGNDQASDCIDCIVGKYIDITGSVKCVNCPPGRFLGGVSCSLCPAGTNSSTTGALSLSSCGECPPGSWATNGSAACQLCAAGTYRTKGNFECRQCDSPEYTCDSPGMSEPHAAPGYYLESPGAVAVRCDTQGCSGGIGPDSCADGYEGDRCSGCIAGFYKAGPSCYKCEDGVPLWAVATLFFSGLLMAFVALDHMLKDVRRVSECAAPAMILLSYFQTLDLVLTVELAWPVQVATAGEMLSLFNFNLALARPECSVPWDFTTRQIITLYTPLAVATFVASFFIIVTAQTCVQHAMHLRNTATQVCIAEEANLCVSPAGDPDEASVAGNKDAWRQAKKVAAAKPKRWNVVRARLGDVLAGRTLTEKLMARGKNLRSKVKVVLSSCMTVLSVFFLKPVVQGLDCIRTADGRRFLDAEPATECDRDLDIYAAIFRRSCVGGSVWLVFAGIFVVAVVRGGQSEFQFLAAKMKPNLFWWELVLLARKITVMIIVTGLSSREVESWFW